MGKAEGARANRQGRKGRGKWARAYWGKVNGYGQAAKGKRKVGKGRWARANGQEQMGDGEGDGQMGKGT